MKIWIYWIYSISINTAALEAITKLDVGNKCKTFILCIFAIVVIVRISKEWIPIPWVCLPFILRIRPVAKASGFVIDARRTSVAPKRKKSRRRDESPPSLARRKSCSIRVTESTDGDLRANRGIFLQFRTSPLRRTIQTCGFSGYNFKHRNRNVFDACKMF